MSPAEAPGIARRLFFYLARHGETSDNARRVFQGQAGSGLNRLGRAQAERLAKRLSASPSPPTAIISSDLERAVDTAKIVADKCAGISIELDKGLREVDVGAWTGKGYDEVAKLFPEEWASWENGRDVRRGGGETYAELASRIDRAMQGIAERCIASRVSNDPNTSDDRRSRSQTRGIVGEADDRILIVSHGGSIKSWIVKILGIDGEGIRTLGGVANAGLTIVERDTRGRYRIHAWNDAAHLEGLVVDEQTD